ncbi:hypothetical protein MXL49_16645 [Enterococcus casseliflavus]|uniref:hypothetical protein n=1 Tax=Enterococcus casseliflavus TaxID=37734 RepID=UPI002DB9823B|nr:hypothetical protein [Enterococcus casseliflavus]MEB6213511.1 hypothetical protein [Enterococcus casseliflavus]
MTTDLITINLDSTKYISKPKNIGYLSKSIRNRTVETKVADLAKALGTGQTMIAGAYNHGLTPKDFVSVQVLAIDFDNEYPKGHALEGQRFKDDETDPRYQYTGIKKVLSDKWTQTNASFIYKTFSYSLDHEKFRLVFVLTDYITDISEYEALYAEILKRYPTADHVVGQTNRMFFGGRQGYEEINFANRLSVSELLPSYSFKQAPKVETKSNVVSIGLNQFKQDTVPNYHFFKEGNSKVVASRLPDDFKGKSFADRMSATTYFNSLDMRVLFGLEDNKTFNSIIRFDKSPSASIKQAQSVDIWLYRDFSVNKNFDNVSLTQELLPKVRTSTGVRKASRTMALNFLLEVTDSQIKLTEKLAEIQNQVEDFKAILLSGALKEQYPDMYQIFGRWGYIETINTILDIFKMNIWESEADGLNLSWLSVETLAVKLGCSKGKVNTLLKMMTLTNIIDVLNDTQIPTELLELIKRNQTHYKDKSGNWVERKTKRPRRSNVYQINHTDEDFFEMVEERCGALREKGFSAKGLSRDWVLRSFGQDEANRVYPQDIGKKTSREADRFLTVATQISMSVIPEKGYITINELKDLVRGELQLTIAKTERKWKQVEGDLINGYGLTKVNLDNALKDKLGITHLTPKQRPAVLTLG